MKNTQRTVVLHQLVDQVAQSLRLRIIEQKSFMINDLNPEMRVTTDENMLTHVLNNLLDTLITYTQNNCICISSKVFGNIVLLHIKDSSDLREEDFAGCLLVMEPLAEKLGGCITLNNHCSIGTTVAFSFYNHQHVA